MAWRVRKTSAAFEAEGRGQRRTVMGDTIMAHTIIRDSTARGQVRGTDDGTSNGVSRRGEFITALSIFVAMSVIGTAFGLWMVGVHNAKPAGSPPTVEGQAPVPQVPPVESARPDPTGPVDGAIDKK
jgi:hypothetical protein